MSTSCCHRSSWNYLHIALCLLFYKYWVKLTFYSFYSMRLASAVYATAYPSVCPSIRLSVTLQYSVKTWEHRGMWASPLGSPVSLIFWCQVWLMGDDPVQVKFLSAKKSTPFWKQPSCTHFASWLRNHSR